LEGLTRLEVLQLQHNQLQQLPDGIGEHCGSLAGGLLLVVQGSAVVLHSTRNSYR
jgi:hypothetical protein